MAVPMESYAGKIQRKLLRKKRVIEAASGREKADLVLKNATYVNVFSNELRTCDIACANGLIVGLGQYDGEVEYDMTGKIVCPGQAKAGRIRGCGSQKGAVGIPSLLPAVGGHFFSDHRQRWNRLFLHSSDQNIWLLPET